MTFGQSANFLDKNGPVVMSIIKDCLVEVEQGVIGDAVNAAGETDNVVDPLPLYVKSETTSGVARDFEPTDDLNEVDSILAALDVNKDEGGMMVCPVRDMARVATEPLSFGDLNTSGWFIPNISEKQWREGMSKMVREKNGFHLIRSNNIKPYKTGMHAHATSGSAFTITAVGTNTITIAKSELATSTLDTGEEYFTKGTILELSKGGTNGELYSVLSSRNDDKLTADVPTSVAVKSSTVQGANVVIELFDVEFSKGKLYPRNYFNRDIAADDTFKPVGDANKRYSQTVYFGPESISTSFFAPAPTRGVGMETVTLNLSKGMSMALDYFTTVNPRSDVVRALLITGQSNYDPRRSCRIISTDLGANYS